MNKGSKSKIEQICRDFKNDMQKMVNRKNSDVTKMTMQFSNNPPITIAERKKSKLESCKMKKKIKYYNETSGMPEMCVECGNNIEDGDECYYHGEGVYTCSIECADEYEGN